MAIMSEAKLIKKINSLYPQAKATPLKEFYGTEDDVGIWFRGSENVLEGRLIYDNYDFSSFCHPKIQVILDEAGWDWDAYDSGTMLAFPQ